MPTTSSIYLTIVVETYVTLDNTPDSASPGVEADAPVTRAPGVSTTGVLGAGVALILPAGSCSTGSSGSIVSKRGVDALMTASVEFAEQGCVVWSLAYKS